MFLIPYELIRVAGDNFAAGYLSKRLLGAATEQSAIAGHQLASTFIQYPEEIITQNDMPELYIFILLN